MGVHEHETREPKPMEEERGIAVPISETAKRAKFDSAVSWADLPPDIVDIIADRLSNLDFCALRQVCSSWCRSVSFPRKRFLSLSLPITVPSLHPRPWYLSISKTDIDDCVLSTGSVYALRASFNSTTTSQSFTRFFFLFAEEFAEGKLWLRNPLTGGVVSELPYQMPEKLNLLELGAVEVAKCYSISLVPRETKGMLPYNMRQFLKVVLHSGGFFALVLEDTGVLRVLNTRELEWGIIHDGKGYKFDDIVEYNGQVFGLDRRGKVYSIEYNGLLWEMKVAGRRVSIGGGRRKRLVVSSGDLYLLVRWDDKGLKAFKLKLADGRWVRETNLGDRSFFVGPDFSFSISTKGLGRNCTRNCILFTEQSFPCYESMKYRSYRAEKDDVHLEAFCFDEGEGEGAADLVAAPAYTSMFWPLPFWLRPKSNPLEILQHGIDKILSRLKEAEQNAYSTGPFKQLINGITKFFTDWQRFVESEVAVRQPSLKGSSTDFQDKVGDVNNNRIGENHGREPSAAALASKQLDDIKELYARVERAVVLYKDSLLKNPATT